MENLPAESLITDMNAITIFLPKRILSKSLRKISNIFFVFLDKLVISLSTVD